MSRDPIPLCPLRLTAQTLSAYRDEALATADAERIYLHLPTCPTCRRRLDAYETLARRARAVPMPAGLGAGVSNPRLVPTSRRAPTRVQASGRGVRGSLGERVEGRISDRIRAIEALAAMLLLTVLASLLFRVLVLGTTG